VILAPVIATLATETGASVDLSPILNVGAFGTLSVLLLGFALTVYRREVKRADAAEAKLEALTREVIDLYVPATREATRVIGEFVDEVRRQRR
jgi:hypothetical protein